MSEQGPRWVRLCEGDDWGERYLAEHPLCGQFQTASVYRAVPWEEGQRIRILCPDGNEATVTLVAETGSTTIGDHGGTYQVSWRLPVVNVMVHGVPAQIRLTSVDVLMRDGAMVES